MKTKQRYKRRQRNTRVINAPKHPPAEHREESGDWLQDMEALTWGKTESSEEEDRDRFLFVCPGGEAEEGVVADMHTNGDTLQRILETGSLDTRELADIRAVAVVAGECIGYPAEKGKEGILLSEGKGIQVSASGECRAQCYGYLHLEGKQLSIISPIWVDPQGMEAYWLLLDERPQPVTQEMILKCLADRGVVEGIKGEAIIRQVEQVRKGTHSCGAIQIAVGVPSEDGVDAQVEFLVDNQRVAGEEREDGSIDFRKVNFAPTVQAGQELVWRRGAAPGKPGKTVRGEVLAARDGDDKQLVPGENVQVKSEKGKEILYATAAGALEERDNTISVVRRLYIAENVDFRTGNLDFDGEICIGGSVIQGFSIKAASHITIAGSVEANTTVTAGGDLTVGLGIVGRKTRATAKGAVRAQFVQESTVSAGGDIILGSFAYQARLRSGGSVSIEKGTGSRRGSAIGGQIWAHESIRVLTAGAPSQVTTFLMVGVDPENVLKLDRMKNAVDSAYKQLRRLVESFGLSHLDVGQIRYMLSAATGARRKVMANKARQLGQVVQTYQKLQKTFRQLEQKICNQMQGTEIRIGERAFPGVEIRLGKHRRRLTELVSASNFRIVDGELVVR